MRLIIFMVMLLPCMALAQEPGYGEFFKSAFFDYWPVAAALLLDFLFEKSPLASNSLVSAVYAALKAPLKALLAGFKKK